MALVTLLIASCGNAASTAARTSSSASAALTHVVVGVPTVGIGFLGFYAAEEYGLYKKANLDVEVEVISSSVALAAVESQSGGITFDAAGGTTVDGAALRGIPVRSFGVFTWLNDYVLVGRRGIGSVSQLKGGVIVGHSSGSAPNVVAQQVLSQYGVGPKDVKFYNIGGTDLDRADLLLSGKADAAILDYSNYLELPAGSNLPVLYNADTPKFQDAATSLIASEAYARSHPSLMRQMLAATVAGDEIMTKDRAKAIRLIEKVLALNETQATKLWNDTKKNWTAGGRPSASTEKAEFMLDKNLYDLPSLPTEKQVYDFSYLAKAKAK